MHLIPPVPKPLAWPVAISALLFAGLVGGASGSVVPLYYPILLLAGLGLWIRRDKVAVALQAVPLPPLLRAVLLGYAGVVAEETLVGLLHGVQDGTSLLVRTQQFITFNLLAFTGIIWAMALAARHLALSRWDLFLLAGCWGIFAEGTLFAIPANPLGALLLILPNMGVYAVILWPLLTCLAAEERGRRTLPQPLRLLTVWALAFVMSLPAVAVLNTLRTAHPDLFPPCAYIACR